jgi:hypothetical protein
VRIVPGPGGGPCTSNPRMGFEHNEGCTIHKRKLGPTLLEAFASSHKCGTDNDALAAPVEQALADDQRHADMTVRNGFRNTVSSWYLPREESNRAFCDRPRRRAANSLLVAAREHHMVRETAHFSDPRSSTEFLRPI